MSGHNFDKRIALDFDGVLHNYKGWDGIVPTQPPVPGALRAVKQLNERGYYTFVYSSRALHEGGKEAIEYWLEENGFPAMEVTGQKNHAALYIDDRGCRFRGDWQETLDYINNINPMLGRWGDGEL